MPLRDSSEKGLSMSKLLTPNEIHFKKFHTHRWEEGYDIDEVNEFLDDVEHTVAALAARLAQYERSKDE